MHLIIRIEIECENIDENELKRNENSKSSKRNDIENLNQRVAICFLLIGFFENRSIHFNIDLPKVVDDRAECMLLNIK